MTQVPQGDDRPVGDIITGLGSEDVLVQLGNADIKTVRDLRRVGPERFFVGDELLYIQRELSSEARA